MLNFPVGGEGKEDGQKENSKNSQRKIKSSVTFFRVAAVNFRQRGVFTKLVEALTNNDC